MATLVSMSELKCTGIAIRGDEAVAVAQKLIHEPQLVSSSEPSGPPSLERVCIGDDGSVICRGCEATPGVAEIAILLEALLPEHAPDVPGALRYTIARALHDVDAPPFDSLDALSAALARHEHGDRDATVRRLAARAGARAYADGGDQRRHGRATSSEYRRLLREADEKLYRQQLALDAVSQSAALLPAREHRSSLARRVAAGVVAIVIGLLILASVEALRTEPSAVASTAAPAQVSTTPPAADPPVGPRTAAAAPKQRPRPRARVQTKSPQRPANKTSSGLFPKFRVVDDFHK
jgi:hypothetical protein